MRNIVVDSGVFIALFDKSDRHHAQAIRFIQDPQGRLHTNLAVITETVHLLDFSQQAQQDFLFWVSQAVQIDENTLGDWERILTLLKKYADLPADFADASLIGLCERLNTRIVATVDSDFTVYRDYARHHFTSVFWDG
ncbi:MAG: PIN domain-containing protein [Gammaproteobacteria bacterium]|nr:PIN domain-containing protein [Gammaproteobacteria bacterium]MBU1656375.1 PIN domain-containing protein [Gammaproteobacteria bacterium]MBU1962131.1 PIN domain-containing protein [Gammaproteobacteria bacterium]